MSATPGITKPSFLRFAVRLAKLGISLFYFAGCQIGRVFRMRSQGRCVVLYYHSVPTKFARAFEKQMRIAASRFAIIDLTEIGELLPDGNSIAITFDDALASFAENAVPALVRQKIPAMVFVVTEALGQKPSWGEGYYSPEERVMSQDQLRSLPGIISIGSHTLTHPNLTHLSQEAAAREILLSRKQLEDLAHRPVQFFSFPHGAFSAATVQRCREAGYKKAFTTEPTLITRKAEQYLVGRVAADPWDWELEFRLKTLGAYCWQPRARTTWKVLRTSFKEKTTASSVHHGPAREL